MALAHGRFHSRRRPRAFSVRDLEGRFAPFELTTRVCRRSSGAILAFFLAIAIASSAHAGDEAATPPAPAPTDPSPTLVAPAPTDPSPTLVAPAPAVDTPSPTLLGPQPAAPSPSLITPTLAGGLNATSASPTPRPLRPPPANLNDLSAWLEYGAHRHIAALPQEARVFYRRGLLVHQSGSAEEAIRLVRGASELDPEFVAPHLTLASWFLLREPSQALLQYAAVLEMVRQSFVVQLAMIANTIYLAVQALFLGLLAAGLLIVWLHHAELRHVWSERLSMFIAPRTARVWAWSFLVLPFALGFGIALPVAFLLGQLWPMLRVRERVVFILLAVMMGGAPWITSAFDRFSAPQRTDRGPFFGVPALANEPFSPEREQQLQGLAEQYPRNAFAQFGLGWEARRGGDLQVAEAAYRRALVLWPGNDRVMNNLGNALAMQGRADEALAMFQRATATNSRNPAALFNASQIYTQRFEYRLATDALLRASALNFDMVKSYQSQATDDGLLLLVDQWLSPRAFWGALSTAPVEPTGRTGLPPGWRTRFECSGWAFSLLTVVLALAAALAGRMQNRKIPLRSCSNCGNVICRRCAQRRRETALCLECSAVESRAESPDFARVLMAQHRRSVQHGREMLRTALATLIPGFGLLAMGRIARPLFLLICTAALVSPWIGLGAPFSYEPRLSLATREIPVVVLVTFWLAIYAFSLLGYFALVTRQRSREAELSAPVRSRNLTTPARRSDAAAA